MLVMLHKKPDLVHVAPIDEFSETQETRSAFSDCERRSNGRLLAEETVVVEVEAGAPPCLEGSLVELPMPPPASRRSTNLKRPVLQKAGRSLIFIPVIATALGQAAMIASSILSR
jgi:hypothetical protein